MANYTNKEWHNKNGDFTNLARMRGGDMKDIPQSHQNEPYKTPKKKNNAVIIIFIIVAMIIAIGITAFFIFR